MSSGSQTCQGVKVCISNTIDRYGSIWNDVMTYKNRADDSFY